MKILPDIFQKVELSETGIGRPCYLKIPIRNFAIIQVFSDWLLRYDDATDTNRVTRRAKSHLIIRWIILIILSTIVCYGYLLNTC